MDQNHFTTDTLRKKGAHLTFEERVIIQTRLRDKQSYRSIAREIGCCVNTVRNEVKRGKVLCYNGKVERYRAADGQSTYEAHRENCGRKCDAIAKGAFLDYVQKRLQEHHWSLDACFGRALVTGEFQRGEMVCTKTLYNYVTLGLLGKIKSIDLPLRVKRKNARKRVRERKKKFGRSIDERDPSVDERQDFGHWECDLVLGSRSTVPPRERLHRVDGNLELRRYPAIPCSIPAQGNDLLFLFVRHDGHLLKIWSSGVTGQNGYC